jgi:hypothetical protein
LKTHSEPSFVTLRGGHVASIDALRLGWNLEARGFRLSPEGDRLRVAPFERLTAQDVTAIKANRDELLALVQYDGGVA